MISVSQEVGSHQTSRFQCLDLEFPSLQKCEAEMFIVKLPSLWCFVLAALRE